MVTTNKVAYGYPLMVSSDHSSTINILEMSLVSGSKTVEFVRNSNSKIPASKKMSSIGFLVLRPSKVIIYKIVVVSIIIQYSFLNSQNFTQN